VEHHKLTRNRVDGLADAVTNAVSVHLDKLALRGILQHIRTMKLSGMGVRIVGIRSTSNGHEHMLAVGGEDYIPRPVAASSELSIAGEIGPDCFWRAGSL